MLRLTAAQRRALAKGACGKGVRIAGGYGGAYAADLWKQADFDRRAIIERLVARGLLRPGEGWNTYTATDAGRAALAASLRTGAAPSAMDEAHQSGSGAAPAALGGATA